MADNFRNKQWFKNLSQERKDEICQKFDIDEKTLRKAGRETSDGRIVIDILRIDHLCHTPEIWDICYNVYLNNDSNNIFNSKLEWNFSDDDLISKINRICYLYCLMHECKYKKYISNLHNDLLVKQAYSNICYWVNTAKESEDNKEYLKFCCYQIYTHCRVLIESDLSLIKV